MLFYKEPIKEDVTKSSDDFISNCLETCLTAYENSEMYAKNLLLDTRENYFMMTLEGTEWQEKYGLNALGIYLDLTGYYKKQQFSYLKTLKVDKIEVYADVKYLTIHNHTKTIDNMKVIINTDVNDLTGVKLRNVASVKYEVDMTKYSESYLPSRVTIINKNQYQDLITHGVRNIGNLSISTSIVGMPWIAEVYAKEPLLHNVKNKIEFNIFFDDNYGVKYFYRDLVSLVNELQILTNNKKNNNISTSLILDPARFYLKGYNMLNLTDENCRYSFDRLHYFFDEVTMSGQNINVYNQLWKNSESKQIEFIKYDKNRIKF